MIWRLGAAGLALACGIGFAEQCAGAELTKLPPEQQKSAACVLDAVSRVRGVTNAQIKFIEGDGAKGGSPSIYVVLSYDYHPRHPLLWQLPREEYREIDITELLATGHGVGIVNGMANVYGAKHMDDDFFAIARALEAKCDLDLNGVTE